VWYLAESEGLGAEMDRETQLGQLESAPFDLLVVGGGATGAGIALDAISRGLRVALIERDDFACGTSSRSTKLLHGGVRYLEQAVWGLDLGQYALVKEALHERSVLLKLAPHLARYIPLLTPLYHRTEVPYYFTGLKMYDWLAGDRLSPKSRYVNAAEALVLCPMLQKDRLRGGVVYFDGQFDDARMNLSILIKACELGAVVVNHMELTGLVKSEGKITGARTQDTLTHKGYEIRAQCVLNATGPACDALRKMDNAQTPDLLKTSSGAHLVLDRRFSAPEMGLLIPKTEDGRVLFVLPWLGHTLVGTTDTPARVEKDPKATQEDVDYILRQLTHYSSLAVGPDDILAKWSGLRPLIQKHAGVSTAKLSREHFIDISPSGLLTIAGGKWTTYRRMGIDAVNEAIKAFGLKPTKESQTEHLPLAGGEAYVPDDWKTIEKECGWDTSTAKYLNRAYGCRWHSIAAIARQGHAAKLLGHQPYVEAEVVHAIRSESARTSIDILARRLRLAFLDRKGALAALPKVQSLLSQELGWSEAEREHDRMASLAYLA
jgi:glycerol-3-phosphate dehydrogenase